MATKVLDKIDDQYVARLRALVAEIETVVDDASVDEASRSRLRARLAKARAVLASKGIAITTKVQPGAVRLLD